jgi:hypothetical protein
MRGGDLGRAKERGGALTPSIMIMPVGEARSDIFP